MSLWNFLCQVAVFDMVCNWFSSLTKSFSLPPEPVCDYIPDDENFNGINNRLMELEQEILESEARMAEYEKLIDDSHSQRLSEDDCKTNELPFSYND